MGVRISQICGLWFWVAFLFFSVVLIQQSRTPILPSTPKSHLPHPSSYKGTTSRTLGMTTRKRMARSESSWRTSLSLRHELVSSHPSNPKFPFFPAQKVEDFGKYPYTLWDFFPATYTCPHDIQRVGRLGDGGKWVCGMSLYESKPAPVVSRVHRQANGKSISENRETIIYSFGINDESTFEAEMLARIPSAHIYAYDYSVTSFGPQLSPLYKGRAHFRQIGLGAEDELNKTPQFFTLQTLMAQNNHTYIDILKVDVEGSEYLTMDSFMDHLVSLSQQNGEVEGEAKMPVGQLMIELHLVDDEHVDFDRFMTWWGRLEKFGMRPTWLEVNLIGVTIGVGKTDPRCVEYVFVNARDERSVLLGE